MSTAPDARSSSLEREAAELAARLARAGVTTIAAAYRQGMKDGATGAQRALEAEGRVLPK